MGMSEISTSSGQSQVCQGPRIAVVAALEREVAPLIRNWKARVAESSGRKYRLFENGNVTLVCGGIGSEAARRTTEAVIRETKPSRIVSVGFAGALDTTLRVADVLEPRTVIDAQDGSRTDTGHGEGMLVSFVSVAGRDQKERLRKASAGAAAVDMEAAAVAHGAESRSVAFHAVKAVSDASSFDMPDMRQFVSSEGEFRTGKLALHVAIRPWLWRSTISLARNSRKASRALCAALEKLLVRMQEETPMKEVL